MNDDWPRKISLFMVCRDLVGAFLPRFSKLQIALALSQKYWVWFRMCFISELECATSYINNETFKKNHTQF